MDLEKDKKDLREFLRLTLPDFKTEVDVVEATDDFNVLLHISKDPSIKEFTPRVAARSGGKVEDTTLPRICTGPSVLDCYVGYGNAVWDFEWSTKREDDFLGGYYVYALPFRLALKPSTKLLSDVTKTNEHWLVGYTPKRFRYKPELIAKTWIAQVSKTRQNEDKVYEIQLYVEVFEGQTVRLSDDVVLTEGYWEVVIDRQKDDVFWRTSPKYVCVQGLSKDAYFARKKVVVSLLSLEQRPLSASW